MIQDHLETQNNRQKQNGGGLTQAEYLGRGRGLVR